MCIKKHMDKVAAKLLVIKNTKQNLKMGVKSNRREIRWYYCEYLMKLIKLGHWHRWGEWTKFTKSCRYVEIGKIITQAQTIFRNDEVMIRRCKTCTEIQ